MTRYILYNDDAPVKQADSQDIANLKDLNEELKAHPYLNQAYEASKKYL